MNKPNRDDIKKSFDNLSDEDKAARINEYREKNTCTVDVIIMYQPEEGAFHADQIKAFGDLVGCFAGLRVTASGGAMFAARQLTDDEVLNRMIDRRYYNEVNEYNKAEAAKAKELEKSETTE